MKRFALNNRGVASHLVLPALVLVAVAAIGVKVMTASHAATPDFYQLIGANSAAQTPGVSTIQSIIQSVGTQTVSVVPPGAELDYLVYGKVPVTQECYYFQIQPLKGGGTSAKIAFGGIGATKIRTYAYDPNTASFLQKACVVTGTGQTPSFNVKNLSPGTGPNILVYQDEVAQSTAPTPAPAP